MIIRNEKLPRIWLSAAHFTNDVYTGMLNPIMPFIAAKLGITMAIATVVLSISNIIANILQPLFGFFADNIVRRVFIFWGLIFSSVFISLAPASRDIFTLILCIIFGSLGSSLFHPQALGFAARFAGSDTAKSMGIFIAMGSLGFSIGPVLSAYIAQYWGLEHMPVLCVFGLSMALLMFKFVPKIPAAEAPKEHKCFKEAFMAILTNNKLQILIVIAMLKTLMTTSCTILLPFLWKSMGYTPFYIGVALFAFIFAGGIGSLLSRSFEQKVGTKNVFYISMISSLPIMIIFALTYKTLPVISLIAFVLMGLFTMMAVPVTMVMAQSVIPQYKSIIGGFINGFAWGIVAVFMSVIGFIAQAKGIIPVLITVSIIPAIFSSMVKYLFADEKQA